MLKKIIPTSIGSMVVAAGLMLAAPVTANAGQITFSYTHGKGHVSVGSNYHKYHKPRRSYKKCSPRSAVRKAKRHGVRHAHIERVGKRFIIVNGYKRRAPVEIAFERRSRHCNVAWFERSHKFHRQERHRPHPSRKHR